ncbi:MAG: hypothetical protein R2815_12510 [Flavobacteriales bacterium]
MMTRAFLFATTLTAMACATRVNAQFEIGDNVAGISIGLGGNYVTNTSQSPALGLSFEHGVTDLGPGVLGIGGYLGYKSLGYKARYINAYEYDWRYTYLILGVRGAWHYNEWHGNDRLDTYGGLMLSYNSVSWKDNTVYPSGAVVVSSGSASSGLGFTGFLGTRYYFNDNFAVHGELGYGIAILNLGLSYKF